MARGYVIDRDGIHRYLWSISNSRNRVQIHQGTLAERYEITQATMSRVMKELAKEGRLKKVASKANNVGVFVITDPGEFPHAFNRDVSGYCNVCDEAEGADIHV